MTKAEASAKASPYTITPTTLRDGCPAELVTFTGATEAEYAIFRAACVAPGTGKALGFRNDGTPGTMATLRDSGRLVWCQFRRLAASQGPAAAEGQP